MEKMLHNKTGERPLPQRRFAGRGPLASGLLGQPIDRETQLLHSNVILEAMMAFSQARDAKASLQRIALESAKRIVRARIERDALPSCEKGHMNQTDKGQLLLEKVLRDSGSYRVDVVKKTKAGTCFRIAPLEGGEEHLVPLSRGVMDGKDPEEDIKGRLLALGVVGTDRTEAIQKANTRKFECFPAPDVEALRVGEEDLAGRRLRYEGGIAGREEYNTFTHEEPGRETTLEVPAGLRGEELLLALERKIAQKQARYAKSAIDGHANVFGAVDDGAVMLTAKEIYRMAWAEDGGSGDLRKAVEELQGSKEYRLLVDIRNEGVLSPEEATQFREACAALDHPLRRLLQDIRQSMGDADSITAGESRPLLSEAIGAYGRESGLCEDALRNLAEAYWNVVGGPERHIWLKESLMRMHLQMMSTIRMAADSLDRILSD